MQQALLHIRQYVRWYALLLLILFSLALWSIVLQENRHDILTVTFLNVGKGSSIFIDSPSGAQILIDAGPDANILKEISNVLPWYDRKIDLLVLTNTDAENFTGAIPFIQNYSVGTILESSMRSSVPGYEALQSEILAKNIPEIAAERGQTINLGGGVTLQILFPDRDMSNMNSDSGTTVLRLQYGATSVLFSGDTTPSIQKYIATLDGTNIQSTILALGYHGALATSSEMFLQNVAPDQAIIFADDAKLSDSEKETENILNISHISFVNVFANESTFSSDGKNFILEK